MARKLEASDPFDKVAQLIADINVPLSKEDRDYDLQPSELPDTPEHWIDNYADGLSRKQSYTKDEAVDGIRSAFEKRYHMSPEKYAEKYVPERAAKQNAIGRALSKIEKRTDSQHTNAGDLDKTRTQKD